MIGEQELSQKMAQRVHEFMEKVPSMPVTYYHCFDMCAKVAMQEFKKEHPITMTDLKKIFKEISYRNAHKNDYLSRADVMVLLSCIDGVEETTAPETNP